jgi:BolA protein
MKSLTDVVEGLTSLVMSVADLIRQKLTGSFSPIELIVTDESAKHAGHSGARPEGETHFDIRLVSAVLSDELKTQVHALSLATLTPAEVWQEH